MKVEKGNMGVERVQVSRGVMGKGKCGVRKMLNLNEVCMKKVPGNL